jgi:hypothetical protein
MTSRIDPKRSRKSPSAPAKSAAPAAQPQPAGPRRVGHPVTTGSGIGPIIAFRVSAAEHAELVAEAAAKGFRSPAAAAAARAFPHRVRGGK